MLATEIVLIIIGVAFLIGSYLVEERFTEKDIQEISKMSETQLNMVVEKQVKSARSQVENSVEEIIDESLAITKRGLEKETNEKIMAISEYSDTVMESMNKAHNEIMFLYSMLNDKHTEMTEFAGSLQKYTKPEPEEEHPFVPGETVTETMAAPPVVQSSENAQVQETAVINKKEQVLELHKEGKKDVEIAKALDCGLGEVRLVLGLYKEEQE